MQQNETNCNSFRGMGKSIFSQIPLRGRGFVLVDCLEKRAAAHRWQLIQFYSIIWKRGHQSIPIALGGWVYSPQVQPLLLRVPMCVSSTRRCDSSRPDGNTGTPGRLSMRGSRPNRPGLASETGPVPDDERVRASEVHRLITQGTTAFCGESGIEKTRLNLRCTRPPSVSLEDRWANRPTQHLIFSLLSADCIGRIE